jgi:phosphatidylserine/phosphatidylglycerophosphate/cardiolipin synthase-like enzyme
MNRAPLLYSGVVLAILSFGIGYSAGSAGLSGVGAPQHVGPAASEDGISCYFSPDGGCTEAIVDEIEKAQHEIDVQAYSFTSKPIVEALIAAHRRGVSVTVVLDKSELKERGNKAEEVQRSGIRVFVDAIHKIAHNKIILIDGRTIITGSFNFTYQAENGNAENLLVLHDRPKLYAAYKANFEHHLGHSEPYEAQ